MESLRTEFMNCWGYPPTELKIIPKPISFMEQVFAFLA